MNCKIRKWKLSDARDLASALSNKKIQDNLRDGLPYPYMEQDGIDFISSMLSSNEDETFAFAITVDNKVIGSIGVFRQQNIHRQTAELGYYIAEEYWGKGIMTAAVKQICEYVFNHSDILRIYAEPFAYNIASCRVLEKAGFQYEGTLRSNAVKNGKVIDMKLYSFLKEEFFIMENISMCKAEKEHIYACAEIISNEHAWQVFGFDFKKSVQVLETMEDIIYIAKCNGKVAGFITLRINGVGNIGAYVRMIAVNSEYRNKGVGKAMVDYIQQVAHDNGMDNIFLICSTDNPKGEKFYLHSGFVKVGILESLVIEGHDEILFRRKYN